MSQKSRVVLRTKFEAGRTPTEKDFADLLDSGINKIDDQISIRNIEDGDNIAKYVGVGSVDPESPVSIRNRSGNSNLLGFEDRDGKEKWQIEIDPAGADEGLSITEKGTTDSLLFIESGGNVGVGTKTPTQKLQVKGKVKADEFLGTLSWNNLSDVPYTFFVPKGAIIMWSGPQENIPNGWALCNGKYHSEYGIQTPDLRDRFIVGAGSNYYLNQTGGVAEITHVHTVPGHHHGKGTLYIGESGNHNHTFELHDENGGGRIDDSGNDYYGNGSTHHNTHSHSNSDIGGAVGNTSGPNGDQSITTSYKSDNRPPFYAVFFIIKIV